MFLDHTRRCTTVGRTPLDEWSASRRDLYLTTHDAHNRQISMPLVGFEPTISAGEWPQAAHLLRSWVKISNNINHQCWEQICLHLQFYIFTILYWLQILSYRITTMRSRCILSLWDSFLWITVSSFLKFYCLLVTWWWPGDRDWNMSPCHLK